MIFDEKNYCLVGRRHHHKYQLGDPIRIKVANANLERKQLDFTLDEDKSRKVSQKVSTKNKSRKNCKGTQKAPIETFEK